VSDLGHAVVIESKRIKVFVAAEMDVTIKSNRVAPRNNDQRGIFEVSFRPQIDTG
jgi:hypothetical protein